MDWQETYTACWQELVHILQLSFSLVNWSLLQVRESLTKRAREFNILLDDVAITHLSFGTEVR